MKITTAFAASCAALLTLAACSDGHLTGSAAGDPPRLQPASATSATTTTVTGFTFLTPTVRTPTIPAGAFDGTRTPTVRISCVTATGPTCPIVRTLVMGSGPSDIRVSAMTSEYRVSWTTPSSLEIGSGRYRIDVLDGATVLGSALARVAITTREAALAGNTDVAIIRGKPVLIAFRITTREVDDALQGSASASAVAAVPDLLAPVSMQDFDRTHPELLGASVSFNTALVRLRATATIGETNDLLREVEATLVGGSRGIEGRVPALLVLRFATTTHAALAAKLAALRASALVLGVQPEGELTETALPRSALPLVVPVNWNWDLRPALGGTWGIKTARVPQMWNLNRFIRRDGQRVRTGVWEVGDVGPHFDVVIAERLGVSPLLPSSHALEVAGILGATHDDGGMDGVTPFATLVAARREGNALTVSEAVLQLRAWSDANVRVVNTSLGFKWSEDPVTLSSTAQSTIARVFMDFMGEIIRDAFVRLESEGTQLPLFVVASGNQTSALAEFPSSLAGPLQNAGTTQGVAAIIIVEALQRTVEGVGGRPLEQRVQRSGFSNRGGHVVAAGQDLMSTTTGGFYSDTLDGTSYAAPIVTGVISYLYSLYPLLPAPTLSTNALRELLQRDAITVPGTSALSVDAFAAVLNADLQMRDDRAFRALLDVDDGSIDGNTRVDLKTSDRVLVDSVGGDRRVSMRDFRRWRDWRLDAEGVANRALNGAVDHPARDLNLDGRVDALTENIYPRGDYNGDGLISATAARTMPSALGATSQTDLQVMQRLFVDSNYVASELTGLLTSSDIEVRISGCMQLAGAVASRTRILRPDGSVYKDLARTGGGVRQVFTVPEATGSYKIRVEVLNASGGTIAADSTVFAVQRPGADALFEAECAGNSGGGGGLPPTLSMQIVSGFQSGTPTSPIRYRARVTNGDGTNVVYTATARSDGSGFIAAGPAQALITAVTFDPPVTVNTTTYDAFANLTYLPNTRLSGGITITMQACLFRNGVQVTQINLQPLCLSVASFFPAR